MAALARRIRISDMECLLYQAQYYTWRRCVLNDSIVISDILYSLDKTLRPYYRRTLTKLLWEEDYERRQLLNAFTAKLMEAYVGDTV